MTSFGGFGGGGSWGGGSTLDKKPGKHQLITWSGYMREPLVPGSRLEEWSFSLKTPLDEVTTLTELNTRASACRDAWVTNLRGSYATATVLEKVVVAQVDDLGKWGRFADGSFAKGEIASPIDGIGTAAQALPLQTALCVTLVSSRAGATGKGRFFAPWPDAFGIGADRVLSGANQTTLLNSFTAFVRAVEVAAGPVKVFSSKGYDSDVVAIRLGRRPDVLRSRADRMNESYSQVTL